MASMLAHIFILPMRSLAELKPKLSTEAADHMLTVSVMLDAVARILILSVSY